MGQYTAGDPRQGATPTRGIVVRDSSGRVLTNDEWRASAGDPNANLRASWEEDPSAPSESAPAETAATPPVTSPPPTAGGGAGGGGTASALAGLQSAIGSRGGQEQTPGWANEPAMRLTAQNLGRRTPSQPLNALSEVMRRFGRTY